MAEVAVGFLLNNLEQIMLHSADSMQDLKGDVEELYDDFEMLNAYFREYMPKRYFREHSMQDLKGDVEELYDDFEMLNAYFRESMPKRYFRGYMPKRGNYQEQRAIADDVRKLVNEAEDIVETFLIQASQQGARSPIERSLHKLDFSVKIRSAVTEIEHIRKQVKAMKENICKYGFKGSRQEDDDISVTRSRLRRKRVVVEEGDVVGFDDEVETIIERLSSGSKEREVIPITGVAGLGKTTLARKVFHDPRIVYGFQIRAFVCVSKECGRREVYLAILQTLDRLTEDMEQLTDKRLAQVLRKELESMKYLIVTDDVSTKDVWDEIRIALPNNKKGSRVLLTTQNMNLAFHANPRSQPHQLRFLTLEESKGLLQRKVFGSESIPEVLEALVQRIVEECGGLPLAIVVIAGVLSFKRFSHHYWAKVARNVRAYIWNDRLPLNNIMLLCYQSLPDHLKPCFLYLAVFSEDSEIPVWKLTRLWIAEGFVQQDRNVSLEDIAEEYLEELVANNLVLVDRRSSRGQIKTCHIHDTMRDACKQEALKENLCQTINVRLNHSSGINRRFCIDSNVLDHITAKNLDLRARSFLIFGHEKSISDRKFESFFLKTFKLLRVLDISSIIFLHFPHELCDLVLLRFIVIVGRFSILPPALSNLRNLQTLIVQTSSCSLGIKADIWKMLQLRHLHTNVSTSFLCFPGITPKGKHTNINLQTLSMISPESCIDEFCIQFPNLKKLGISGKIAMLLDDNGEHESCFFDNLVKMASLENLKLLNENIALKLHSLPRENKFPAKLSKLTLMNTGLDWKYMSVLGRLENLEVLKLKDSAFLGEWWLTEDGGFLRLRYFHIGKTNLANWNASAQHFPRLRCLVLWHCSDLKALPSGLADISSLEIIQLFWTSPLLASSARKIQHLKQELLAEGRTRDGGFKLSVYPPEH